MSSPVPGRSTLMTSAPRSPGSCVQCGPADAREIEYPNSVEWTLHLRSPLLIVALMPYDVRSNEANGNLGLAPQSVEPSGGGIAAGAALRRLLKRWGNSKIPAPRNNRPFPKGAAVIRATPCDRKDRQRDNRKKNGRRNRMAGTIWPL